MAIKIYPNRIEFEKYSLVITNNGLVVSSTGDPSNTAAYGTLTYADAGPSIVFQGTNAGYSSGGYSVPYSNVIDKFPFATVFASTDAGDLSVARGDHAGQSSSVSGYASGGFGPSSYCNTIDKFPFSASAVVATSVGVLTCARRVQAGQSGPSSGYTSGGGAPDGLTVIDRFPFSNDRNSVLVGCLSIGRRGTTGQSSAEYGYTSGGQPVPAPADTVIDKFPFATDVNATAVGNLSCCRWLAAGASSSTHGYTMGGYVATSSNIIDRFPFASDGTATDVGDLSANRSYSTGISSSVSGFTAGGGEGSPIGNTAKVDKFPFTAPFATATCVGSLTVSRRINAGHQI